MGIYSTEYRIKITTFDDEYQGTIWKNDNLLLRLSWPPKDLNVSEVRRIERLARASQYFFSHMTPGSSVTIEFRDALRIKDYVWSGRYLLKHPNAGKPENRLALRIWAEIANRFKKMEFYQNSSSRSGYVTSSPKHLKIKKPMEAAPKVILRKANKSEKLSDVI